MAHEEQSPADGTAAAAPAKAPSPWMPIIAVLVLMPAISFAATQFLILPRLKSVLAEQKPAGAGGKEASSHGGKEAGGHGGKESKGGEHETGKFACDFENIIVNLSGSLGTKYLKTSFTLNSSNANLKKIIEENKKQLQDVAINILSSRTLADLEAPGSKNVIRNDLMAHFNEALHSDLIDQIFITEFVIQ